jgi:RNA polymerase sigma-70 factor (ECF subfamily)
MPVYDSTRKASLTSTTDDHELVKRVKLGETDAFDELVKRYYGSVYNLVAHSIPGHEEREDSLQEIFLKVYVNIPKFRFESSFSTWLFSISRNYLIDRSRKKKLLQVSTEDEDSGRTIMDSLSDQSSNPEKRMMESNADRTLRDALTQLDDDHKHVLILREIEGFSYMELAQILKINIGTVKSRLARAREELKSVLSKAYEGE